MEEVLESGTTPVTGDPKGRRLERPKGGKEEGRGVGETDC